MTEHIVSLLIEERSRLQAAIDALKGEHEHGLPDWVLPKLASAPAPKRKRFSAATRRKMAESQKRRYAAINAAKAEPVAPKKQTVKAAIAEVIAPKADEEFRARMSKAMKKAWAKRKES